MSRTVHYKGIAKKVIQPVDKSLNDIAESILGEKGCDVISHKDALEYLCENYYEEYFFHTKTQTLYSIEKNEFEPDAEIITATENDEGGVEFELRYYNGGAGFNECLDEAMNKMTNNEWVQFKNRRPIVV